MMPDCTDCKFANWQRTKQGRLHPSGNGRCTWNGWEKWTPARAYYYPFRSDMHRPLKPSGGFISRRDPHTAAECCRYQPIEAES